MPDSSEPIDTVVIGAGHAGLAISRILRDRGVPHVVLERDSIGSSWRQRWASFHLNTPNAITLLPGQKANGDADGFMSRDAWLRVLERYQADHDLPVRTGMEVRAVSRRDGGYTVATNEGAFVTRNVVVCSGDQNTPRVPKLAAAIPESVEQLHSSLYDTPSALPPGGVLVVGSGQTGVQIVEDLRQAGRDVWLCTSRVGRAPRRYRGRDITAWAQSIGMFDQRTSEVPENERRAPQGMISGTEGGHSVSLHLLGNAGATLLGRLAGVEGTTLTIGDELLDNVAFADEGAAKLRGGLDKFIAKAQVDASAPQTDAADDACPHLADMARIRTLDLRAEGIGTVIWATGFGGDFSYLPAEFLDGEGRPNHTDGVLAPGLCCLGLTWLRRRASGLIAGAIADAEFVANQLQTG